MATESARPVRSGQRRGSETDTSTDQAQKGDSAHAVDQDHKAELDSEIDSVLDEIDEVLEENAEEFVRSFVQKGGQ
jgi:ubiquitin-like protein Pup